jgi:predicted nucleotidyltransferase component of viral defense system
MISSGDVAKLATRLRVGQRVIEKDYVLSWLLVGIAESELRNELAFKGGTALKKVYYPDYRFSEDLDFTLRGDLPHNDLVQAFEPLFVWLKREVNLTLEVRREEQSILDSTTLLVNYVGPLRASLGSRHVKADFTRGELLLHPLADGTLHAPSYDDYPTGVTLPTYSLEEILTEKLCALIGRTEPRDLYDVYWLFEWGDVDLTFVPHSFARKCAHKGQDPTRLYDVLRGRRARFEKEWAIRLSVQVRELPEFNEVL